MDKAEALAFMDAQNQFLQIFGKDHSFTASDLRQMHRTWLGSIYSWAGEYRNADISKEGMMFAHAAHIPTLMVDFENTILKQHTPCLSQNPKDVSRALAEVHVELILIHPFREGNGRIARALATLMVAQSGRHLPKFDYLDQNKRQYFSAIQAGIGKDYGPLQHLFEKVIIRR